MDTSATTWFANQQWWPRLALKRLLSVPWAAALMPPDNSSVSYVTFVRNRAFTLTCKGISYLEGNTQNECVPPTVKIKQKPNKPFVFSIQSDSESTNPTNVALLKGRRATEALTAAYVIFPSSNIITRQVLLKAARQAACPGVCTWKAIGKNMNGRGGLQLVTFLRLLLTLLDLASPRGGQYWTHHSEQEAQCPLDEAHCHCGSI